MQSSRIPTTRGGGLPLAGLILGSALATLAAVEAFPGAGGGGAGATGGRGGDVYHVTSLKDDGSAGTLRHGLDSQPANQPRTIVFDVGGTISLNAGLWITRPNLTIAGQTAPGGGIQISGKNIASKLISVEAGNVIIRYLRLRKGLTANSAQSGHPIAINSGANIVIDHCTLMWTCDENAANWGGFTAAIPRNITWSWCLIAEPLQDHPTSVIYGATSQTVANQMTDIDMHHCVLANSSHRNPRILNKRSRFISNIVYNWRFRATQILGGVEADIINNLYRPGPLNAMADGREIEATPEPDANSASGKLSLHVAGNIGPSNRTDPGLDNWSMVTRVNAENGTVFSRLSEADYRRGERLPQIHPISMDPALSLPGLLLPEVGASRRLTEAGVLVDNRDNADRRVIDDVRNGTGWYVHAVRPGKAWDPQGLGISETEFGTTAYGYGFPVIQAGVAYADADRDGMADVWERAHGLDPADPVDRNGDYNRDGYTNLEKFLSGRYAAAANRAPVSANQSVTAVEDAAKPITLVATDADGDALAYAIAAGPSHGTVSGSGRVRTYTPAADFAGVDSFTFTATDGRATSNVASVSIVVTAVNDAPVAQAQSVVATRDVPRSITLVGTDVDGGTLNYSVSAPAHGTLTGSGPVRIYTPAPGFSGPDSFTFTVGDGLATSQPAQVSITVNPSFGRKQVNFQPSTAATPPGWLRDSGQAYGARGGQTYGWDRDLSASVHLRDRNHADSPDQQHDTHILIGAGGSAGGTWEMAVPNGGYEVTVVMGDPYDRYMPDTYRCLVEGTVAVDGDATTARNWLESTVRVTVADGRLSVAFPAGATWTNKLCSLVITAVPLGDG